VAAPSKRKAKASLEGPVQKKKNRGRLHYPPSADKDYV